MPLLLAGYSLFRFECGMCGEEFKTFEKEESLCPVCQREKRRAPIKRKAVQRWVDEILDR